MNTYDDFPSDVFHVASRLPLPEPAPVVHEQDEALARLEREKAERHKIVAAIHESSQPGGMP